jgi:hypothetical protein
MHRFFSAALAIVCLLAALSLAILMLWSFGHFSFHTFHVASIGVLVRSTGGVVSVTDFAPADWLPTFREPLGWRAYLLGFGLERRTGVAASIYTLYLPHWFIVALLLLYPLRWARRTEFWLTQSRQRRAAGQCLGCGYDLRMHKSGDRCPECGQLIPAKRAAG